MSLNASKPKEKTNSPNLEENLGTHTEKAVHDSKCEYHRHAVDVPISTLERDSS